LVGGKPGEMAEDRLSSLVVGLKQLEAYYNELASRESLVSGALLESRMALEALNSVKGDEEVLVPIGGGCFIRSKVIGVDRLPVRVGADVYIEKSKEDAISFLEERVKGLTEMLGSIRRELAEVSARIRATRGEVNRILAEQRERK